MKKIDMSNIEEAKEFERVAPGGYVCRITAVKDVPEKEYLILEYDIAEGKFQNYYRDLCVSKGFWGGTLIRSYKEAALPFFKGFTSAVEKSNPPYQWNWEENTLVGKTVGLVLGEEEYIGNDGTVKTRLYVVQSRSVSEIRAGNFKMPDKKRLKTDSAPIANTSTAFAPVPTDDDCPFI